MAQPMEEVEFSRDIRAVLIPDGYEVPVAQGTGGWITQVLGGNYTVQIETGRLVRVASRDADAIGKEPRQRVAAVARPNGEVDLEQLWDHALDSQNTDTSRKTSKSCSQNRL